MVEETYEIKIVNKPCEMQGLFTLKQLWFL